MFSPISITRSSVPGSTATTAKMRSSWSALFNRRADVVLSAHDHGYERFAPQRSDGALMPGRGIRQFVVGTGGGPLQPFDVIKPNSEVRNANANGLLKVDAASKQL